MEPNRERYRALPGRRRGLLFGSSVWLGSDHLLLVKSSRFREEYKRFYFRDIQAIVFADARRYHISSRSFAIGAVLLIAMGIAAAGGRETAVWIIGSILLVLALLWAYVSTAQSCRCRIYTAVSSEELPSVYRARTAHRFLKAVEPHIHEVQGAMEGSWAEAAEEKQIGSLPEGRMGLAHIPGAAPPAPQPEALRPVRTRATVFFALTLFLGGVTELFTLRMGGHTGQWVLLVFLLLQIAAAAAVLVLSFSKGLRTSMRSLAIVTLICIGVWYYAVSMAVNMAAAFQAGRQGRAGFSFVPQGGAMTVFDQNFSRTSAGCMSLVLGLVCGVLLLRDDQPSEGVSIRV